MHTLTINRPDGAHQAPVLHMEGGLAVVEAEPGRYTVTHIASGNAVWPFLRYQAPRAPDPALAALRVALAVCPDWTQDRETIKAVIGDPRELWRRMRLAADPPRRPRWHRGERKRRLKPYAAQSKRAAIREAAGLGMRWLWRDLWVYERRGAMWGMLPPVVRQPCVRCGVTQDSP